MSKVILFKVQFFTVLEADQVNNEMRMYMCRIRVCSNNYFVVTPLLRKLQGSSVSFLRSYVFIRVERLHKMKIHFTITLAMLKFRAYELCVADLRLTVDACNQLSVMESSFLFLYYIFQYSRQTRAALSSWTIDCCDCRYVLHLLFKNFLEYFLNLNIEPVGLR